MPPFVRAQLDYYMALEIGPSADTAEINAAFRRLAWRYHPDRNPRRAQRCSSRTSTRPTRFCQTPSAVRNTMRSGIRVAIARLCSPPLDRTLTVRRTAAAACARPS
jgi:hypothetical protein